MCIYQIQIYHFVKELCNKIKYEVEIIEIVLVLKCELWDDNSFQFSSINSL